MNMDTSRMIEFQDLVRGDQHTDELVLARRNRRSLGDEIDGFVAEDTGAFEPAVGALPFRITIW